MIQHISFWVVLFSSAIVFWLLPLRWRPWFLVAVSVAYLARYDALSVAVLIAWSALFYLIPQAIVRGRLARTALPFLLIAVVTYLAAFKYVPRLLVALGIFEGPIRILIPLGISFYTFKLIHYAIEVVRGNIKDPSPSLFLLWVFLFPIFTAGPIERFDHFLAHREDSWKLDSTVEGLTRIIHGLIKKFVFGALLIHLSKGSVIEVGRALVGMDAWATPEVWAFLVLVYLYAYMDFSAYSDIAIGSSRLFGIRIMENFNWPVIARNISDFWKRWHITLAAWCQAYIYLPMVGLTRNPYIAVISTFFIIGLWHAGTLGWVAWGLYHGIGVSAFLTWSRIKRQRRWVVNPRNHLAHAFSIMLTFAYVTASFSFTVIHDHAGIYDGLRIFAKLFFIELPR